MNASDTMKQQRYTDTYNPKPLMDSSKVTLKIPRDALAEVTHVIGKMAYSEEQSTPAQVFRYLTFPNIKMGELRFLPQLRMLGIPYEAYWEKGAKYGAGTEYNRYDSSGKQVTKTVYDEHKNPDLTALMSMLHKPDMLQQYILEHYRKITPLPWTNQVEYGKMFRTINLIMPISQPSWLMSSEL